MDDKFIDYQEASSWERLKHSIRSWKYIGVGKSLLIWFLAISFVPLATLSFINYLTAYQGLTIVADKSLNSSSQLRLSYINTYFEDAMDMLKIVASSPSRMNVFKDLTTAYNASSSDALTFTKSEEWNAIAGKLRPEIQHSIIEQEFYNFLFIDAEGNVLFSSKKDDILGRNLFSGSLNDTHLSLAARESMETNKMMFSDLEVIKHSFNRIGGFFLLPALENNKVIGLLALQITMDGINKLIQQDAGYGETGQAYLIGSDLYLRSSTRFGDDSEILQKKITNKKTLAWKDYLNHKGDNAYLKKYELDEEKVSTYDSDGNGKYVLGVYRNIEKLSPLGVQWALIEEIEHSEAFENARKLSDIAKISFVLTILIVLLISILVTRWFVNPIKHLSSWGKQVAIGELQQKSIRAPQNEIGVMRDTFNSLVGSLQYYASVAKAMAKGDYSEQISIRSENDVLGKSINQMVESFKSVVNQANKIAEGDYTTIIQPRSDNDSLGKALYSMTEKLRKNADEMQEQDWIKTGFNQLDSTMRGHQDLSGLCENILSFFVSYLDAQLGLFYIQSEDQIKLASSFALKKKDLKNSMSFAIGEGIVGQVFKDQKSIVLHSQQEDELPVINFGVGEIKVNYLLVIPFSHEDQTIGVLEIGLLNKPTDLQLQFIDSAGHDIALAIITLKSHIRVRELLERTQEQANELEVQQEELRQTNEELQEQTKALKHSQQNLQTQQEELKVTNEELAERSKILENQKNAIEQKNKELEAARKEIEVKARDLEMASQYKSEFLANMSHELRTPLNSINVLSQLLAENKKEHLDHKEIQYAQTINSSGNDLLELINDILDLSKVESGQMELNIDQLFFEDLKVYIEEVFQVVMDNKGLKLKIVIDKNVPDYITSDVQRVHQIIKNLFSNAIKFTEKGSITLRIHLPDKKTVFGSPSLKINDSIAFSVIDTGIGIPIEKQELIFEAFKQADGTTSRKYGGTGLGLSISRNFSQVLGGEMQLTSNTGKGSTFTLYLPINFQEEELKDAVSFGGRFDYVSERVPKEKAPLEEPKHDDSDSLHAMLPTGSKIHDDRNILNKKDHLLLIIEDDYTFAGILLSLAHDHDFKALIALTGETGLYMADYYEPDAIILDIGLPGIDGYQVMEKLKINKKTRHIPVHFISAADRNIDAFKMGAIGYITKPVKKNQLDEVFQKIENIISKPVKKLIVVEDEAIMRKSITNLMEAENISITAVESGQKALEKISSERFDCMILDLGLEDMTGFELLDKMEEQNLANELPVVIYTGKELSEEENDKLRQYAQSIILKGARSFERLLAETTLFLHQIESKMPEEKKKMLETIHGKDNIIEGKTILVVDDDMRNVFALTSLLESMDAKVVVGKNGKEGVEKLKNNPEVDLVLMDIMMPEMNGYEAMRLIRKDKAYQKLPIIALTAKAMKEDREKCLAAGANEYLAKPVDKDKLISLLRVWLYK